MKKLGLLLLSAAFFLQSPAKADENVSDAVNEASAAQGRFTTIYVGRGRRGRDLCFSYQGREVVVEGDMIITVKQSVYWSNGDCDLYY